MLGRNLFRLSFKTFQASKFAAQQFRFCNVSTQDMNSDILDEIETDIFALLKSKDKCQADKLTRTATFEELGFDSLDSVEIVVEMEEVLNVNIENDEAEKIKSVHDAIMTFYNYKVKDTKGK